MVGASTPTEGTDMKTTHLALGIAVAAAVAAPAALAHPAGSAGPYHAPRGPKAPKNVQYLLHACVATNATPSAVDLRALWGNRQIQKSLAGATTLTTKIGDQTRILLTGRARKAEGGMPKVGTYANLTAGDRVVVRFRAPRGTAAADLPPAVRIVDHGPAKVCAVPAPAAPTG